MGADPTELMCRCCGDDVDVDNRTICSRCVEADCLVGYGCQRKDEDA